MTDAIYPDSIYQLLVSAALGRAAGETVTVSRILLGLNWTVAEIRLADGALSQGLCFSPVDGTRALSWPGTLAGKPASELVQWITSWNPCEAAVGTAVINALINSSPVLLERSLSIDNELPPHLRVFGYFAPQLKNQNVVVVGHYPEMERLSQYFDYQCIERAQKPGDYPDAAADFLLPKADWVFITASSIANKTLPRLLKLSERAQVVLMGPSLPWMLEWKTFGVNYLAGVEVREPDYLHKVAAEGGGMRIFSSSVRYRVLAL
jgi:Uncharacterized conserved protein